MLTGTSCQQLHTLTQPVDTSFFLRRFLFELTPWDSLSWGVSALHLWKQTDSCLSLSLSYAIADNSYRSLRTERKDQCILISGESGAGKTEATKKILQYYAVTCPASQQVETVKDRLLQSNPVLEVTLERAARELDIESHQQCSHFPVKGVWAAGAPRA